MKTKDIFTPGRFPEHTFVDDHLVEKGQQLHDAIDEGSMLVSISGPSKSGKTVFVEHLLGKDRLVQVTGAGINSSEDLWNRVFEIIGTVIPHSSSNSTQYSVKGGAKVAASTNIIVAGGSGETSVEGTLGRTSTTNENFAIDYLQLLIKELANTDFVVFIDDFHYIPRSIQSELAKQIKEAIRQGVKFICASVPYHSDDVIRSNPDLRGRIFSIDFDYWGEETLRKIAHKGFNVLDIVYRNPTISRLVAEAAGSPQLMQILCLNSCYELGVREKPTAPIDFDSDNDSFTQICKRTVLSTDYSSVVEKMLEGPKIRGSERKLYLSSFGWQGDVYRFLVKAISLDPPELTFRYQPLVDRINGICASDTPSGSSITSACFHATSIANSAIGDSVIEWDSDSDVLDIRDPYLLFYIRWSDTVD